ncbi:asparagine synthase (glutamine-hydrolyzing) [Candidatus Woesearchaeota archaeon]|nr:asparagine synthase (glutamine-hydrolyzing) [Candidatus Woesearchaeota archaeon]
MCGITGICNFNKKKVDKTLLEKMTGIIKHRGPDNQGTYITNNIGLGYRRLTIIDTKEQSQPILHTKDNNYWITFNGEIYNYKHLKENLIEKGHKFYTKTDTEVVLHMYLEYAEKCVAFFNGMFAFAILDKKKNKLFIARDRLGIKPLYYYADKNRFLFASEMKAILEDKTIPRIVNKKAIVDYMTIQNVFGSKTFIEEIKLLLPGHYIVVENNTVLIREYWDLQFNYSRNKTEQEYVIEFKQLLDKSVNMQLMSDVPLGCYLSGGIDSSAITTLASRWKARNNEKLNTFTGAFKQEGGRFDEREFAKTVAEKNNTIYHEIFPREDDLENILTKIVWHLDEPRTPSGAFPIFFVAKDAAKTVKVVLTGHGGDEIFCGYPYNMPLYINKEIKELFLLKSNPFKIIKHIFKSINIVGFKRFLGYYGYTLWNEGMQKTAKISFFNNKQKKQLFAKDFYDQINNYNCYEYIDFLTKKSTARNKFDLFMYLDVKTYLPMLLLLEDKMDMANSLEGRVPIIDHTIVEFAAGIPIKLKMKDMTPKYIIRKAMEKELPQKVLDHKKQGFPVPLDKWFRGSLKNYIYKILLEDRTINRGYFNKRYIRKILDQNSSGLKNRKQEIWCLLTLELWHRLYIDEDKELLERIKK